LCNTSLVLDAGPSVATILVFLGVTIFLKN
jgi:hypothetical protein